MAVGDIEAVRKSAFLRILKDEVKALRLFEQNVPMFLLRKIHIKKLIEYPNRRTLFERYKILQLKLQMIRWQEYWRKIQQNYFTRFSFLIMSAKTV